MRCGLLAVAALVVLAAFGALAADLQPSLLRVMVTAVVALLAPLFWPGIASTSGCTAGRIAAWSAAGAGLAAIGLRILGGQAQPLTQIFASVAMLMPILLATHALAAGLEATLRRWCVGSVDVHCAREAAGNLVTIALALLGSLPLWLGPAGELLSSHRTWIVDVIVGVSPLTHLAVASDNDLFRSAWLYQHSNLAALPVSYPGLAELAWCHASVCGVLALAALWRQRC